MEMQVVTVVHWGKDGAWYKNSLDCFAFIYCWSDSSHCERKSDEAHVWIDGEYILPHWFFKAHVFAM